MNALQVMLVAVAIILGVTGCASSHTRHTTAHATSHGKSSHGKSSYGTSTYHKSGHGKPSHGKWTHSKSSHSKWGQRSTKHPVKHYAPPAPYTLPGGLQSVCTGGTPPPCN